jgi:hypothetical protein
VEVGQNTVVLHVLNHWALTVEVAHASVTVGVGDGLVSSLGITVKVC